MSSGAETARKQARKASVRMPIADEQAEQAVLGSMFLDQAALALALRLLRPEMFFHLANRLVFEALGQLFPRAIDLITLREQMQRAGQLEEIGGVSYLAEIAATVPSPAHVAHYAEIVRDRYVEREVAQAGARIQELARDGGVEAIEKPARAASMLFGIERGESSGAEDHRNVLTERLEQLLQAAAATENGEGAAAGQRGERPTSTGFYDVDEKIGGGLHPGEYSVLAGDPGDGKTALAVSIAEHIMDAGGVVFMVSCDMTKGQLADRRLCMEGRVHSTRLRSRNLAPAELDRLSVAYSRLCTRRFFVEDKSRVPIQWLAEALRIKAVHGRLDLMIIDYIQLAEPPGNWAGDYDRISAASRQINDMKKELMVPILCLSQLNRMAHAQKRQPDIRDLRGSGQIEQDADAVWFVWQPPEADQMIKHVLIRKQRQGPAKTEVPLIFFGEFFRFENAARKAP